MTCRYEDIIFPEEYLVLTCDKYIPDVLLGTQAERVALEDCKEDSINGIIQVKYYFVDFCLKLSQTKVLSKSYI